MISSEKVATPVLETRRLSKTFDGRRVLDSVSLSIDAGTVHALMGGNGSGKSTLIKCLSGFYVPDAKSEILVEGQRHTAMAGVPGLAFVHQDLGLIPDLTVMENLAMGRPYETNSVGRISWKAQAKRARSILEEHGIDVSPHTEVGDLSAAMRASVGIARALSSEERISLLVLDEPTASLAERERERLLDVVRHVRSEGTAILYVSHRMQEVMEISDTITVLRDGHHVVTEDTANLTEYGLIELMMGEAVEVQEKRQSAIILDASPRLEIDGLGDDLVDAVSLSVQPGEILGMTGLVGAGHNEFGRLAFGANDRRSGTVTVNGRTVAPDSPQASIRAALGYIPADRKGESTIPEFSVRENMSLITLGSFQAGWTLLTRREKRRSIQWSDKYDVKPRNPELPIEALSGGNQQKAIVCKWVEANPQVLIVDEPTQGVDVRARAEIYRLLEDAAADGASIILIDTDVEELVRRCDRIAVFFEGRLQRMVGGLDMTRENIFELANGLEPVS